jgi:hypothetical protein
MPSHCPAFLLTYKPTHLSTKPQLLNPLLPACWPATFAGCMPNPLLWRNLRQASGRQVLLSALTPSHRSTSLFFLPAAPSTKHQLLHLSLPACWPAPFAACLPNPLLWMIYAHSWMFALAHVHDFTQATRAHPLFIARDPGWASTQGVVEEGGKLTIFTSTSQFIAWRGCVLGLYARRI